MNQDSQAAKHTFNAITLFDEIVLIISRTTPENLFLTKKSQSQWINISTSTTIHVGNCDKFYFTFKFKYQM
jgi:hypothetical protein